MKDEESELEQWQIEGYSHPTLRVCIQCHREWHIKPDSCEWGLCDVCEANEPCRPYGDQFPGKP
jgi:hypothetical protein